MAGLSAASALRQAGRKVLVLDKGRGVGGRLATRRAEGAVFDHGAQFVTARTTRWRALIDQWSKDGVATEWCRGFSGEADGHPRWRGQPGMTALAKSLAQGIDVRLQTQVTALRQQDGFWNLSTAANETLLAHALILTAPVPQSLALLDAGGVKMEAALRARLEAITYERCLVVMATLDGVSNVPPPGGVALTDGPIAWIGDNQQKGISVEPALTIHASAEYSLANWDRPREETARELLAAAAPWLGGRVRQHQMHGWRYSRPQRIDDCAALELSAKPPLILAGDAFAGARVEGAALSGWAAAEKLLGMD